MSDNPRTIFTGPAGTGKTLLAIEAARRGRGAGHRVLFLCYNRPLGLWLQKKTADLVPQVTTSWLHSWMLAVSGLGQAPDNATQDFWENRLPELACDRLLETCGGTDQGYVFDELVVDEAQDILRDSYLDFLDLSLCGGLGAGAWRMFGDFANASIYDSANMWLASFRSRRGGDAPVYSLRVNCRNTPLTTEWVQLLSDLDPRYSRVLRPDDGVQPAFRFYEEEHQQAALLVDALSELHRHGFTNEDIVVLSPRRAELSAAACVTTSPWRERLRPLGQGQGGYVRYSSIKSYKGLESPAVIITDIETMDTGEARSLFYVALTRALQRVVIFANERVKDQAIANAEILAERRDNAI